MLQQLPRQCTSTCTVYMHVHMLQYRIHVNLVHEQTLKLQLFFLLSWLTLQFVFEQVLADPLQAVEDQRTFELHPVQ